MLVGFQLSHNGFGTGADPFSFGLTPFDVGFCVGRHLVVKRGADGSGEQGFGGLGGGDCQGWAEEQERGSWLGGEGGFHALTNPGILSGLRSLFGGGSVESAASQRHGTDTGVTLRRKPLEYEIFDLWSELSGRCLVRVGTGFCWVGSGEAIAADFGFGGGVARFFFCGVPDVFRGDKPVERHVVGRALKRLKLAADGGRLGGVLRGQVPAGVRSDEVWGVVIGVLHLGGGCGGDVQVRRFWFGALSGVVRI